MLCYFSMFIMYKDAAISKYTILVESATFVIINNHLRSEIAVVHKHGCINNNSKILVSFFLYDAEHFLTISLWSPNAVSARHGSFLVASYSRIMQRWLESSKVITFCTHKEYGSNREPRLPSQSHFRDYFFERRLHLNTKTIHILHPWSLLSPSTHWHGTDQTASYHSSISDSYTLINTHSSQSRPNVFKAK